MIVPSHPFFTSPERAAAAIVALLALAVGGCTAFESTAQPRPHREVEEGAISSALPDPLAAGWRGQKVCERLHEDEKQRVLRCTFPPGIGHERHFHAPHFGYVVAGSVMQITDESGTRDVTIDTGTSWSSEGTAWHEVVNVGETTGVYLIVEAKPYS